MKLVFHHVRAGTLELVRYPAYSLPTVAFPSLLFLAFGSGRHSRDPAAAMAGFSAMAVLGVVLFQFGVGIAGERASPWESFLRVLPIAVRARLLARVLSGLVFATVASSAVVLTALVVTSVTLPPAGWLAFAIVLLAGAVPFGLLGIALGYLMPARAALPLANILFLPLAYAGGLFGGPRSLPELLSGAARYLPTRVWGDWLFASLAGELWRPPAIALLAFYAVAFAGLAAWGYRRDEGRRFR